MKILKTENVSNSNFVKFKGTRTSIKAIEQLSKNNAYSLTEPNQRLIINAIEKLSKTTGKDNINFLLKTAANSTYSTSIELENRPKNDWKTLLLNAAKSILEKTPLKDKSKYLAEILSLEKHKKLNSIEKDIMTLRNKLLKVVNQEQIKKETSGSIKDFKKNLDYFIVSSETTKEHKKYVLERLNYLMNDEYKINEQLKDKKSIVAAEIVNDIAINTPGNEVPNIKAVNQKQHGICGAISIVRKKLAYEDKPNYIDSLLSELDNSDFMKVYDRTCLGTGKKVSLPKTKVDFTAALAQGYRIIDASATQWMQASTSNGYSLTSYSVYTPFDKDNFGVNRDAFHNVQFADEDLKNVQVYYQALVKIKELLEDYKANKIKTDYINEKKSSQENSTLQAITDTNNFLRNKLAEFTREENFNKTNLLLKEILNLKKPSSGKINKNNEFEYIANEETITKRNKVKKYILAKYPEAKIDDKSLDKFFDMIDFSHELTSSTQKTKNIRALSNYNAKKLYEIAAALRYLHVKGVKNKSFLKNFASEYKIKQDESLITDTINQYINIIKNDDKNSAIITKQIAENFELKSKDKNTVLEHLNNVKGNVNYIIDEKTNKIFDAINLGNKEEVFASYLDSYIEEISESNDAELKSMVANALQVKNTPENLIKELTERKNKILRGDKETFNKTYETLGTGSQLDNLKDYFDYFMQSLQGPNGYNLLVNFAEKHNLDLENNPLSLSDKINEIKNEVISMENELDSTKEKLKIRDDSDNILYSPDLKDVVLKVLEEKNIIASKTELQSLQEHFQRIANADDMSKKQKKELSKFSDLEKNVLYRTEKDINQLYKQIKNELAETRTTIKEPLENLKRIIGVNEGHYYVTEGSSGLYTGQSIRILEYITGKHHYIEDNFNDAIEGIKTTPYSSITSSSVSHKEPAMHAQYVVDVAPVMTKNEQNEQDTQVKEALFHDNTWGKAEKENTWVDSNGLTRSDYNASYGGKKGYLVNDNYQNGNLVENLSTDLVQKENENVIENKIYKKIKPNDEGYKFLRYQNFLSEGKSLEAEETAASIQKIIFTPGVLFMDNVQKYLKGLTEKEIVSLIKQKNTSSHSYLNKYNSMKKRIDSADIKSKEDFDKLPNNDFMKVTLEKIALKSNYDLPDKLYEIAKITTVKDLMRYEELQTERAFKELKYAFNKDSGVINYLINEIKDNAENTIINILKKYGHNEEEFLNIKNLYKINKKFNGKLHNITENISQAITDNIEKTIKDKDALYEIKKYLNKFTYNKLIFKTYDIENPELEHIIDFIDKKFSPNTDKELVNIYNKIQEMDTKEFNSKILPQITKDDLWIGKKTGYDIFNEIRTTNNNTLDLLNNELILQDYITTNPEKKVIKSHTYNAHTYENKFLTKYDFNNVYGRMQSDLSILLLPKIFNKYKDKNINKHNAYPAYPKVDYMPDWVYQNSYNEFTSILNESIYAIKNANNTKKCYEISEKLEKYNHKLNDNTFLTYSQYKAIRRLLRDFLNAFGDTDLQSEASRAALEALDIPQEIEFREYRPLINKIVKRMDAYKKNYSEEKIQKDISLHKDTINKACKSFINGYIQERYHNKVTGLLNDYKQALIKETDNVDIAESAFNEAYHKYHLLNNPQTALDTYLKSLAKDSPLHDDSDTIAILMQRALYYSTLANLQAIIMNSINEGNENIIKSYLAEDHLKLSNNSVINIATPKKVYDVAKYLVLDNNIETAIYFIDKLGLNEKFIDGLVSDFNFDEFKKVIEKYALENKKVNSVMTKINDLFNNTLDAMQSNDNAYKILTTLKSEVKQISADYSLDKSVTRGLIQAINNYNRLLKINKIEQPEKMFEEFAQNILNGLQANISGNLNSLASDISNSNLIVTLANNVNLRVDSKSMKKLEEFNKKIQELSDYKDSLLNLQAK